MKDLWPIPRYFKPGQKATLDDLKWARKVAAKLVAIEPDTLPIFQHLDREIIAREERIKQLERAKLFAENGVLFE